MEQPHTNPVAQRTRKAIADALLSLIWEQAYERISVTDICKKADVVRKTFYNNFRSKDDVVRALIQDIFLEVETRVDLRSMSVREMLVIVFDFILENRAALICFYQRGLLRFAKESIAAYITRGHVLAIMDANKIDGRAYKYLAAQIPAVFISVIETWIENGFEEPVEFMAELTEALMYKPGAALG